MGYTVGRVQGSQLYDGVPEGETFYTVPYEVFLIGEGGNSTLGLKLYRENNVI